MARMAIAQRLICRPSLGISFRKAISRSRCSHGHSRLSTDASLPDHSQLEDLPSPVLAQLLRECQQQKKELEDQLQLMQEDRYVVDPPRFCDRVGRDMRKRAEIVSSKWTPAHPSAKILAMRTQRKETVYDTKAQAWKIIQQAQMQAQGYDSADSRMNRVISSPLLLYRVRCLFPVEVLHSERYKCIWSVLLTHRTSRKTVEFSEHKGACYMSPFADDPHEEFVQDALELLNLLCHPQCPHTYDGTVAGSVA